MARGARTAMDRGHPKEERSRAGEMWVVRGEFCDCAVPAGWAANPHVSLTGSLVQGGRIPCCTSHSATEFSGGAIVEVARAPERERPCREAGDDVPERNPKKQDE